MQLKLEKNIMAKIFILEVLLNLLIIVKMIVYIVEFVEVTKTLRGIDSTKMKF